MKSEELAAIVNPPTIEVAEKFGAAMFTIKQAEQIARAVVDGLKWRARTRKVRPVCSYCGQEKHPENAAKPFLSHTSDCLFERSRFWLQMLDENRQRGWL